MNPITAIGFESKDLAARAHELAKELNLVVDNDILPRLDLTHEKLVLLIERFAPLYADFSKAVWQKRRDAGKKQGLVRACKPTPGMRILDTTAGWGKDSAILASFGAEVLMLERQPVMAALLSDGLSRMPRQSPLKLKLLKVDAKDYLMSLAVTEYPDVIYIDPMHPAREKAALVKKEMQALQQILGADNDANELLQLARQRVLQKVVIKWPQKRPPLLPPTSTIAGKTVRFDIYHPL